MSGLRAGRPGLWTVPRLEDLAPARFVARQPEDPGLAKFVARRPEDLVLEQRGKGVPVQIDKDIDLGHYRRVSVSFDGTDLLLFVPKSERMPADAPTVRPRRMLLYADGRLLGVTEPAPAAALRA